jgi:murein L,D-transpeptidase YafK
MLIHETGHRVRVRRCLRILFALVLSLASLDTIAARAEANSSATSVAYHPPLKADRIVVLKSRRVLELLRNGAVVKTYPIALGEHPRGAKRSVGDGRTPEGTYYIDARQPHSHYYLALHVSYPNAADKAQAVSAGRDPGGNIMIHGLPAWYRGPEPERFYKDWTDGCVSVGDAAIEEIYAAVEVGTPIEIRP